MSNIHCAGCGHSFEPDYDRRNALVQCPACKKIFDTTPETISKSGAASTPAKTRVNYWTVMALLAIALAIGFGVLLVALRSGGSFLVATPSPVDSAKPTTAIAQAVKRDTGSSIWEWPPFPTIDGSIDIKGFYVGMTKAEAEEKRRTQKDFTIAGVRSTMDTLAGYGIMPFKIDYRDDKLDSFAFVFDSSSFEAVLGAVKAKYPQVACQSFQVNTAIGGTFEQLACGLQNQESGLHLARFAGDIKSSALILLSRKQIEEGYAKIKQREKDL